MAEALDSPLLQKCKRAGGAPVGVAVAALCLLCLKCPCHPCSKWRARQQKGLAIIPWAVVSVLVFVALRQPRSVFFSVLCSFAGDLTACGEMSGYHTGVACNVRNLSAEEFSDAGWTCLLNAFREIVRSK